jgi:O-antigen ligase
MKFGNPVMATPMGTMVASEPMDVLQSRRWLTRGWDFYLVVATLLVPILYPPGPSQMAIVDPINAVALLVFFCTLLVYHIPLRLPLALPVFVALLGCSLAMFAANNVSASLLALLKDAYLYFWYAAMVAVLQPRGTLRAVRLTWVWTGIIVALVVYGEAAATGNFTVQALLLTNRERATGTFTNPNMLADYQVFSIFILLSLLKQVRLRFLIPALLFLVSSMVTAKSNGGLVSLVTGLTTWGFATAWARGVAPSRVIGVLVLTVAIISSAVWLHGEFGIGDSIVRKVTSHSFVGRMGHSGQARGQIWHRLVETYKTRPLGIGVKNSSEQIVAIGERERPNSYRSKEAHDDYLAFALERGPLGLAGLLLGTGMAFAMVGRGRKHLDRRLGSAEAGGAVWAAFLGALAASSMHSLVIEKLHFRHFWLLLALITTMCTEAPAIAAPRPSSPRAQDRPDLTRARPALQGGMR